jgi:hypothetical protein
MNSALVICLIKRLTCYLFLFLDNNLHIFISAFLRMLSIIINITNNLYIIKWVSEMSSY